MLPFSPSSSQNQIEDKAQSHLNDTRRNEDGVNLAYDRSEILLKATYCLLVILHLPERDKRDKLHRSEEETRQEAVELVNALNVEIKHIFEYSLKKIHPKTVIGQGSIDAIRHDVEKYDAELVIVDGRLSPTQQRNLERAFKAKVLDRTGLILEIFGARARTNEGRLQVELAHLIYQKSRLVRSWTHLERQRGGLGFIGGPGESQRESDRRQLQERILQLESHLAKVRKTRALHRQARADIPFPIIALVGYTNAGKSTLFNALSSADVFAKDMLFATLDPTARKVKLPSGCEVILSDTVGFISNLPTELIEAFKATLEEVLSADVILHIRDIRSSARDIERVDVIETLEALGIEYENDERIIEVWNKIDLLTDEELDFLAQRQAQENAAFLANKPPFIENERHYPNRSPVLVSAIKNQGFDQLETAIDHVVGKDNVTAKIYIAIDDGAGYSWLHQHSEIMQEDVDENFNKWVTARLSQKEYGRALKRFNKGSIK